MKIICLHGCCQTPEFFQQLLKSTLQKKLKNTDVEFVYLSGPYPHPEGGLTWTDPPLTVADIWSGSNALEAVPNIPEDYRILEASFRILSDAISTHSSTVLLGFSQGSFVITEYLRYTRDPRIQKAILFSGYTFDSLTEEEEPVDCEILNVVHPMDNVVPKSLMYRNAKTVEVIEHNNKNFIEPVREAHVLPTRAQHIRGICDFILKE